MNYISSKLLVYSPQSLINEFPVSNEIPYTLNNFGKIPYGRSMTGHLILSNPKDSCNSINSFKEESDPAAFLLSLRGNCTYVTKAKYAQLIETKLLIIISNENDNSDESMNDDGFGSVIHIPSIVIDSFYGDILMSFLESSLNANKNVLLTIEFDVEKTQDKLIYIFWLSSSNRNSYKLIRDFKQFYIMLQNHAKLEVHYLFWTCETCANFHFQGSEIPNNCVSGGRYCCSDPDGEGEANGRDIVLEDLRQICLFKAFEERYFDYIDLFDVRCVEFQVLEECSKDILKELKLDYEIIKNCVNESFLKRSGINEEIDIVYSDNNLLKNERKTSNYYNVHFWPSVMINNMTFQGNLESNDIFEAICTFFKDEPSFCFQGNKNENQNDSNSRHLYLFLLIFAIFLLVFVIMIKIYKKIVKKELEEEMNGKIQDMMNQYVSIIDKK